MKQDYEYPFGLPIRWYLPWGRCGDWDSDEGYEIMRVSNGYALSLYGAFIGTVSHLRGAKALAAEMQKWRRGERPYPA